MWLTWEMWGVSALLLLGGELWTQTFVLLWPALGAAAASIGALMGLSRSGQLLTFSVSSMVLLALSRTVFHRILFPDRRETRTNADGIPGREVEVLERVAGSLSPGTVRLGGEVWNAYSSDGVVLEPGRKARVLSVDGLKLVITAAEAVKPKLEETAPRPSST